jgi:peroxiredoxin Q/BCP
MDQAPILDGPLGVGNDLPSVGLVNQDGSIVDLRERAAESTLILYFYPFDGSPGCTTQACAIRDSWPLLRASGVEVYGINSADSTSHQAFRGRYGLPFDLLTDPDRQLARAFGFVRAIPGISGGWSRVERSTVIVDPGGRIRAVLRKVKPTAHFDLLRVQLDLRDQSVESELMEPT